MKIVFSGGMDKRVMQAISDMRKDLARLELKLSQLKQGDYYRLPDGTKFDKRSVLEDQILELRQRLKEELERQKDEV